MTSDVGLYYDIQLVCMNIFIQTSWTDVVVSLNSARLIVFVESNRFTHVRVGSSLTDPKPVHYGVPQGSILGQVLFNCIMAELPSLLSDIGISSHQYADDTQL